MNKMSRYQKLPSDEVETFKTAVFQIHAPTKRKKAMLHDCLYRHHLACDHCLRKIDDHLDNLISKSVKERKQIIKTLIHPIVSNRPLGLAAKDGLRNHIEASVESYVELRNDYEKRIKNRTEDEISKIGGVPGKPSINTLTPSQENWVERLEAIKNAVFLDEETEARNDLLKESKAGQLRPVDFPRYRKESGFLILYSEAKQQYFVFLNLHSSKSKWATRIKDQKTNGKKLDLEGLIDARTGEIYQKTFSQTGALFPINFGEAFQLEKFIKTGEPKSAKLVQKGDHYFVHIAFSFKAKKISPKTYLGVDRGIHNLASIAVIDMKTGAVKERKNFDGMGLRHVQKIHERRQKQKQKKGKVYRQKTRRAESDKAIHHVANVIVEMALKHQSKLVVENLSPMSDRKFKRGRSNFNRMLNRTQYQKLLKILEYKLASEGLPMTLGKNPTVFSVNAGGTSINCPKCGHRCGKNRDRSDPKNRFKCQSCGFEDDADLNAAVTIALKKKWRDGLPDDQKNKKLSQLVDTNYSFSRFLKLLA